MYSFISGRIVSVTDGSVVIENNGIGYELSVSANTMGCCSPGKNMQLFTFMQVREDDVSLYGFATREEKVIFKKLIGISGVGPKMALQALSGMSVSGLLTAVASEDVKTLSKIKGVGKKTAERICLELRGQLDDAECPVPRGETRDGLVEDALFALASLGIPRTDAYRAVIEAAKLSDRLEEVITIALRGFDKR